MPLPAARDCLTTRVVVVSYVRARSNLAYPGASTLASSVRVRAPLNRGTRCSAPNASSIKTSLDLPIHRHLRALDRSLQARPGHRLQFDEIDLATEEAFECRLEPKVLVDRTERAGGANSTVRSRSLPSGSKSSRVTDPKPASRCTAYRRHRRCSSRRYPTNGGGTLERLHVIYGYTTSIRPRRPRPRRASFLSKVTNARAAAGVLAACRASARSMPAAPAPSALATLAESST